MSGTDERQQVVDALLAKHPIFPRATIERLVNGEMDQYRTAKVHSFVPVLVQRAVNARLQDVSVLPDSSAAEPVSVDLRSTAQASDHASL